jgi:hypothetical protein
MAEGAADEAERANMYSLRVWTNPAKPDDVRIYINGTTRQGVYFKFSTTGNEVVWSSKTNDTPPRFRTGDHYGKIRKDGAAASDVAAAYGFVLGAGTTREDFDAMLAVAQSGLELPRSGDE